MVTPNRRLRLSMVCMSGSATPFSHLDTAWWDTFTAAASPCWVSCCLRRSNAMVFPTVLVSII